MDQKNLIVRNSEIAQDRLAGMKYQDLAKKYNISKTRIGQILTKPEIKDVIDAGTNQMISLIPLAVDIQRKAMDSVDNQGQPTTLAVKASENVLKTGAVMPSNLHNQTITNIYTQNNSIITPETMELVKKLLPGFDSAKPDDEAKNL